MLGRNSLVALCCLLFAFGSVSGQTFSRWGNVVNLGSVVNSTAGDSCLFVTQNGLSLYFGSARSGGAGNLDIFVSQRATVNDAWGAPQSLGSVINTDAADHVPYITPDGHTMIFSSSRTGALGANDLYASFRRNASDDFGWEAPVAISELNSTADDFAPWGFDDTRSGAFVLYFASDRAGGPGGYDIYSSTRQPDGKFSSPVLVPELSTSATDTMPTIREDGLECFVTSNRPGGLGGLDIWTSSRGSIADPWGAPAQVGAPVSSTAGEQRAGTFGNATRLFFFSGRSGGLGGADLYQATRTRTVLIPVTGSTNGANGHVFKTTAQFSNAGAAEISGNLVFHPAGLTAGSADTMLPYRLGGFESRNYDDLLGAMGVSGIGSIEIVPETGPAPAAVVRIENGGSVVIPPLAPENVLSTGDRGALTTPADPGKQRMNIGFRSLDSGVTMTVALHDSSGSLVRTRSLTLAPNYLSQMPAAELTEGPGGPNQSIVITIDSGSVLVYGSTLSNGSRDSTFQLLRRFEE